MTCANVADDRGLILGTSGYGWNLWMIVVFIKKCESALFLEPKITSSLCDAVGSEDEKQTRTLTNGKDRHHN